MGEVKVGSSLPWEQIDGDGVEVTFWKNFRGGEKRLCCGLESLPEIPQGTRRITLQQGRAELCPHRGCAAPDCLAHRLLFLLPVLSALGCCKNEFISFSYIRSQCLLTFPIFHPFPTYAGMTRGPNPQLLLLGPELCWMAAAHPSAGGSSSHHQKYVHHWVRLGCSSFSTRTFSSRSESVTRDLVQDAKVGLWLFVLLKSLLQKEMVDLQCLGASPTAAKCVLLPHTVLCFCLGPVCARV